MDTSLDEVCKFSRVSDTEWKETMPSYRAQQKEWFVIPNFIWVALVVITSASIIYYQNAWSIAGFFIGLYSAAQLGSRSGNIDGFQIGYEWGKEKAIMQAYKLSPEELYKITK